MFKAVWTLQVTLITKATFTLYNLLKEVLSSQAQPLRTQHLQNGPQFHLMNEWNASFDSGRFLKPHNEPMSEKACAVSAIPFIHIHFSGFVPLYPWFRKKKGSTSSSLAFTNIPLTNSLVPDTWHAFCHLWNSVIFIISITAVLVSSYLNMQIINVHFP